MSKAAFSGTSAEAIRRIQVLPPEEAKRIAAGEVVDRPAALIREFLDNAIDAGAANIDVSIEGGGSKRAEVSDDGSGMGRDDLEICCLAHATSKIRSLDDLDRACTLGFRGEALAAAAAVAHVEIISSTDGREAWRLESFPGAGSPPRIEQTRRTKGSTVRALDLFSAIPARKRFLKREGSEAALCRQVFLDKALAFPEIIFRFTHDGKARDFLPAAASKKERFAAALLEPGEAAFLHEIHVSGQGFTACVVIGGPELARSDKRQLYVFANGRRIQDYSLVQAMEYGSQGWFPNGTHPLGAVFIDIEPALADFNIHPAKREVRFRDPGAIHHAVSAGLRNFCRRYNLAESVENRETFYQSDPFFAMNHSSGEVTHNGWGGKAPIHNISPGAAAAMEALLEKPPAFAPLPAFSRPGTDFSGEVCDNTPAYGELRFAGRAFGIFIFIEWGNRLFIIDQHAAHERILYNRFLAAPIPKQELLAPIPFTTESADDDSFLAAKREDLIRLGVEISADGVGWLITALPADWRMSDAETVRAILDLRTAGENIAERWAATFCCHKAVRDGDYLDDTSAFELARQALDLSDPHCPHGRPVWTEISREALFKAVKRI